MPILRTPATPDPSKLGTVALGCAPKSAGGIRRVWVGDRDTFGTWHLEETSTLQYGRISGSTLPGIWYPLFPQWQGAAYAETQEALPTRAYVASLKLPYSEMSAAHRDVFERMAASNKCVFVVMDTNGVGWLIGEDDGCLVSTAFDSQTANGVGTYAIMAEARQTWPLRQVSETYLANITEVASSGTDGSWTGSTLTALAIMPLDQILTIVR